MARIDRFVDSVIRSGGGRLILSSGAKAVLDVGGRPRTVTDSQLGRKLLDEMIREIAPPDLAAEISGDGDHRFVHACAPGKVIVRIRREGDRVQIELAAAKEDGRSDSGSPPIASPSSDPRPASDSAGLTMDVLFRFMVDQKCSDLHLSSGSPPLFRRDGKLADLTRAEPLTAEAMRDLLVSIAPPDLRDAFERSGDVDFAYEIPGTARFRCNLFVDRKGPGGVFRIIPVEILTTEDLGLSSHILDLCRLSKGLVLVTGPTGSGKSTTLAAMVDWINRNRTDHIITIEDPIEFIHENKQCLINQREVGGHTKNFKSALRAALREDPDIVLVGEMRDLETVEIAIETAETGHLVFGTLHTNTAPSTVDRIIDQFPTERQSQIRIMLSESLKGVIAQTLCSKKGGGRVAALEVLIVNHAVSNLIREGKTFQIPSIMQTGRKRGMATLNDALLKLVSDGVVDPLEARSKAVQAAELVELMRARGIDLPADTREQA